MNDPRINSNDGPNWWSFVLSLCVHATLFLLAFLFVRSQSSNTAEGEPQRRVSVVLSVNNEDSQTEYLDASDTEMEQDSTPESMQSDGLDSSLEAPPKIELPQLDGLNGPVVPDDVLQVDANAMTKVPESTGTKHEFVLSADDLKMIARDQALLKSQQPVGEPTSISLFGSGNLKGRKFVFVLDRSQSMGAAGLGVIQKARTEVTNAVNQLESNHSFQIVGFNDKTVTVSRRAMLPATNKNKQLVPEFIANLMAFGPTQHEHGLIAALTFRPDVVVFMTDGGYPELNDGQLKFINRLANEGGGTEIHCVQFGTGPLQQANNFMIKLASQNNGSFRYQDVSSW